MVLDSNIIIAYLAGEEKVVTQLSKWKEDRQLMLLSAVVEAEVLGYSEYSDRERQLVARFLADEFVPMVCDRIIARRAATLRGTVRIKLPDAIIAATALVVGTPLVTRNIKDFKNVPDLQIISL